MVRSRVTDTGIGIPADKLEKIFESFNQGDHLKTRKFGGTGLGLSISKQIVELQGGVIWVESVDGRRVHICLCPCPPWLQPLLIAWKKRSSKKSRSAPCASSIAEDNPFNVIVTEDTLRSELKDVDHRQGRERPHRL